MDTPKNTILVPFDFTEVADNAVQHAIKVAKELDAKIHLLHIAKKEEQISELETKLREHVESLKDQWGVQPGYSVKEGTIFKTINAVVEELNCILVVMGTHGMKGLQKLTGSWALKVIVGSKIPYLVVQSAPKRADYQKVVFPIDYKAENKEKLKWIQFLYQFSKPKVYIYAAATKEGIIDSRTKANVVFSKKYLEEKGVDYELVLSEGTTSFSQETIQFSEKIDADLVLVMTTRDIAFHDYVLGAYEQYIIANSAKMPVLVINPRTDLMKYGYGGFG
ncbi:universal stress protein [Carboxylicivirga sp. M1479]|uniref:universal stress protein n=1 Tax=Carboxylicivirga sp. M1479 TaxID=2594476 RepID=UPI001177EC1A|nr:universal stress protein [Carboxylicivirga sp. M1479]TRX71221.1 universal stress protein [Carboxylicivirga sp. M1479]